jgi:hypothetical protein
MPDLWQVARITYRSSTVQPGDAAAAQEREREMNAEWIIRNMRNMAWERAKGELLSMKHTFWDGKTGHQYEEMSEVIDEFINKIESDGLYE